MGFLDIVVFVCGFGVGGFWRFENCNDEIFEFIEYGLVYFDLWRRWCNFYLIRIFIIILFMLEDFIIIV